MGVPHSELDRVQALDPSSPHPVAWPLLSPHPAPLGTGTHPTPLHTPALTLAPRLPPNREPCSVFRSLQKSSLPPPTTPCGTPRLAGCPWGSLRIYSPNHLVFLTPLPYCSHAFIHSSSQSVSLYPAFLVRTESSCWGYGGNCVCLTRPETCLVTTQLME